MMMLKWMAEFARQFKWYRALERWAWGLPQPIAAIVTSLGHAVVTALTGPLAPVTAVLYTRRDVRQLREGWHRSGVPVYDYVLDIVLPWCVVAFYAYLAGRWL